MPNRKQNHPIRSEAAELKSTREKLIYCACGPDIYRAASFLDRYDEHGFEMGETEDGEPLPGQQIKDAIEAGAGQFFRELADAIERRGKWFASFPKLAPDKREFLDPGAQLPDPVATDLFDPAGYLLCAAYLEFNYNGEQFIPNFAELIHRARTFDPDGILPASDAVLRNIARELALKTASKRGEHLRKRNSHD